MRIRDRRESGLALPFRRLASLLVVGDLHLQEPLSILAQVTDDRGVAAWQDLEKIG